MASSIYDIITIGGGIGGSALAKSMAQRGARVMVLEREKDFRDRVRGEFLAPWGVAEAINLGLSENLEAAHANQAPWIIGLGPDRDLTTSTPQGLPALSFYHPNLQDVLLDAAADSGAEVRRGSNVRFVDSGSPATIEFDSNGEKETVRARLVVGCDGRSSGVGKWGNFNVRRDVDRLTIAGVLLEGGSGYREDAGYFIINPALARGAFVAPQTSGRFRSYLVHRADDDPHLQGEGALSRFIEGNVRCGVPSDFYANVKAIGPLASFQGADSWVEHPYQNGIALIGDAAATSDPCWGQGLALTLRDARALRDALLADEDWDRAAHAYAREHDRYYGALHTVEDWLTSFFYHRGDKADARRAQALPLIMEEPSRVPDHLFSGPDLPADDNVRKRFFGET